MIKLSTFKEEASEEFEKRFVNPRTGLILSVTSIAEVLKSFLLSQLTSAHTLGRKEVIDELEARDREVGEKITPKMLHEWYLEAVSHISKENYNPNAAKPYEELNVQQKAIDVYIAEKCNSLLHSHEEKGCCDGECNHDDCCGKIPENCTYTKDLIE